MNTSSTPNTAEEGLVSNATTIVWYLFAEALAAFPGSKQLLSRALGGCHVLTVRDGDVHAAAVGLCHRAGIGGKRVHGRRTVEAPSLIRGSTRFLREARTDL